MRALTRKNVVLLCVLPLFYGYNLERILLDGTIAGTRRASKSFGTLTDLEVAEVAAGSSLATLEGYYALAPDNQDNRDREIAAITRGLKAIARELQVPVVALSQLNRQIETRGTEPMLSDLRDSGSVEADADLVMFLWNKDVQERRDGVVRLKLAKHRNGPTAEIDLHFEPEITRFRDLGETRAA
jgi:hypothetical protein